jgi:hypothetical protein
MLCIGSFYNAYSPSNLQYHEKILEYLLYVLKALPKAQWIEATKLESKDSKSSVGIHTAVCFMFYAVLTDFTHLF